MKTTTMKMKRLFKGAMVAAMMATITGVSGMAFAITPANTTLTNTAQLMYTGLSSPISASVNVTVSLTPSAPLLSAPLDQTTAENQSVTYLYTIVAAANGSDVYDLTGSLTPTNLASTSAAPSFYQGVTLITDVELGSTAASTAAGIGDTVINVPSDGVAGGGVNNLVAGNTVVIDGATYTIDSVSDNGVTASITLTSALTTTVSVGELIPESQTFTAVIPDVGSVSPAGSSADVIMDITATSQADNSQDATDQTQTIVVEVSLEKLVRNVTDPNGSGAVSIGGQNYFSTAGGVIAKSTDVLEYVLRVTAPAATALTGVTLSDSVPAFTTYVPSSTRLNGAVAGAADVAGESPLAAGFLVNDASSVLNSGNVAASASAVVTFQVTVQ